MAPSSGESDVSSTIRLAEASFFFFLVPFAFSTAMTWFAQIVGLEFSTYAYLTVLGWLITGYLCFRYGLLSFPRMDRVLWILMACGLIGALSTLAFNRPDADDYYYLPNALHFMAHSQESMGFGIKYLYPGTHELISFAWGTSTPFEYVQAAFAYVIHADLLDVYYWVTPSVVGFLTVMGLVYLILFFSNNVRAALFGSMGALVLISFIHDTHFSIGNLYLVRAFQGKYAFLATVLPFYLGFSLRYFEAPRKRYIVCLAILCFSSLGMSASALVMLLFASFVFSFIFILTSHARTLRNFVLPLLAYQLPMLPLLIHGFIYRSFFSAGLGFNSPANIGQPQTMMEHLGVLFNGGVSLSLMGYLISWLTAIHLAGRPYRKILLAWGILPIVLVLNPWCGDIVIERFHLENIFWRLFYILPFPVSIGLALASVYQRLEARMDPSFQIRLLTAGLSLSGILLTIAVPLYRDLWVFPFRHKLPPAESLPVHRILETLPPGTILAPPSLAGLIAVGHPKLQNFSIGEVVEKVSFYKLGRPKEAVVRISSAKFLETGEPNLREPFLDLMANHSPDFIVSSRKVFQGNRGFFRAVLWNYRSNFSDPDYIVFWRRGHP